MSGTATTQAGLNTAFRTGQAPGSITSTSMLNLIASQLMPNTTKQVFRPEFPPYSAKFDGTTDDTTAWVTMLTAVASAGGGQIMLPAGVSIVQAGALKIPNYTTMIGQGAGDDGVNNGTVIRRKTGSAGVVLDTSGTTDSLESVSVTLSNFAVESDGGSTLGAGVRWLYGTKCFTNQIRVFGFQDSGFLIVASQDSVWYDNMVFWCGQGGTASSGATIGQSAILISGGTASSGLGASTNGCNNLDFINNRVEQFGAEGIAIQKNLGTAGTSCSQIRFNGNKFETLILGGTAGSNSYMLTMSNDVRSVWLDETYFGMDAATWNVGFIEIIQLIGNADIVLTRTKVWIGTASQVKSIVTMAPGSPDTCLVDQLIVDGVPGQLFGLNSGAMWNNTNPSGGLVPYREVKCITASAGTQFTPAYPPLSGSTQTTQSITAVGQTIATGVFSSVVLTTTTGASMTGMILAAAGNIAGGYTQKFTIINTTAFTIVFAASGTSHVFGTPTQAANVAQDYIWDGTNSLWRQVA